MKCPECNREFQNKKSLSNHTRWQNNTFREQVKKRIGKANLGKNNGMWKGDDVSIKTLHDYMYRHIKKPVKCQCCKKIDRLDLANISQEYKRELTDWEWLCRRCHMTKDNRINNRDNKGRFIGGGQN